MPAVILAACVCAAAPLVSCREPGKPVVVTGRAEVTLGEHAVVVTTCEWVGVLLPRSLEDAPDGRPSFQFAMCRGTEVVVRGDLLYVNGQYYGHLAHGDDVTIDGGKVLLNNIEVRPLHEE